MLFVLHAHHCPAERNGADLDQIIVGLGPM